MTADVVGKVIRLARHELGQCAPDDAPTGSVWPVCQRCKHGFDVMLAAAVAALFGQAA